MIKIVFQLTLYNTPDKHYSYSYRICIYIYMRINLEKENEHNAVVKIPTAFGSQSSAVFLE